MPQRYALYYAPEASSPLAAFGDGWLGRDPRTDRSWQQPRLPDIGPQRLAEITADPRRYGFHATLKAPFQLHEEHTADDLMAAVEGFAASTPPARADGLRLDWLDGFLALRAAGSPAEIDDLAARVVEAFEPFRAPLTQAELARRKPERLGPRHRELLERYGYPYVFEEYRFHMTLTARLADAAERAAVEREVAPWARPFAETPFTLDAISIFEEPSPGTPFRLVRRVPLAGARAPR